MEENNKMPISVSLSDAADGVFVEYTLAFVVKDRSSLPVTNSSVPSAP
jgi:hypothetical protein